MKFFFCILIPVVLLLSCNREDTLKRSITAEYKEVFYGYKVKNNSNSSIQLFSKAVALGFNIPEIEKSPASNEIRVYFVGPFKHRFFRQQLFANDSLITEIYMCYMKTSNDSFYFIIKDHIVLSGKYYNSIPHPASEFPDGLTKINNDYDADGPDAYFVEVKEEGKVKSDYCREDIYANYEGNEKSIYALLQQIEKDYTFKFNNGFEKITQTFGSKLLKEK